MKDALANVLKGDAHGLFPNMPYLDEYTWCDACDLFVLHEEQVFIGITLDDDAGNRYQRERWRQCVSIDVIEDRIGDPPHPQLRLDADCTVCPPRYRLVSDAGGNNVRCEICDVHEVVVGNHCHECNWWERPDGDECVPCPAGEHFVDATASCEACPGGAGWDDVAQVCVPCDMDAVIAVNDSWPECGELVFNESSYAKTGDNCPHEFWIEFTHLDVLVEKGANLPTGPVTPEESIINIIAFAESDSSDAAFVCDNTHWTGEIYTPAANGNISRVGQATAGNHWNDDQERCLEGSIAAMTFGDVTPENSAKVRVMCDVNDEVSDCIVGLRTYFGCVWE